MDPQVYARKRLEESRGIANGIPVGIDTSRYSPQEIEEGWLRWQAEMRDMLQECLGRTSFRGPRVPMEARIEETREFPGYRRETVTLTSRPDLRMFGYFLTPNGLDSPRPGILCLPGHGRGVDSIVGIVEDGNQRDLNAPDEYQADFALQCVAHGYPTFAIEQISFGHRRDAQAQAAGGGASSCVRDSMAALMLGETMTGWRVWDAMRGLDYLETRPEVDPKRLATMGISGGGLTSLFTACLDERVKVAVVSGYLNTFYDSILAMDHCVDNYAPGLSKLIEMPDMVGLIAPRALFAESGAHDPIFPLPAFRQAVARAQEIYAAVGVPERFDFEVFEGDHRFHGVGAFRFLERYFG